MFQLMVTGRFAAAHSLRNFHGRCESLHGHNWRVEVVVKGSELTEAGILLDFSELKQILSKVLDKLDHGHLNEIPPFNHLNPSSENIAKYLYDQILPELPLAVSLVGVSVWESEDSKATYFG